MAKKNTTATTVNTTSSEGSEQVQTPAVEVQQVPQTVKVWLTIGGVKQEVDVPVEEAVEVNKMFSESDAVKAQKAALAKAKIAADAKAKRDEKKAERMNDPEFQAKLAARQARKEANKQTSEKRDENRERREAKKQAELDEKISLLTESGSSLPVDRLIEAKISKKFAHGLKDEGVQRGWSWKIVYLTKGKKTVEMKDVIDLDKEGVGTLETAFQDARKVVMETLAELS